MMDDVLTERLNAALAGSGGLQAALELVLEALDAETGTVHGIGSDGLLHLAAAGGGIPEPVLQVIRAIPVGKGMAGLAVERAEPVTSCNIQTDDTGDVRPGARATGLEGAVVVPMWRGDRVAGALGVANRTPRTFTDAELATLTSAGRILRI